MNAPLRLTLSLASLLLLAVAGSWLSGWLLLQWWSLPDSATPWLWPQYLLLHLPQLQPHRQAIRISGGIGLGLAMLLWFGTLVLLWRPSPRSLHGDARFASRALLRRAGLFRNAAGGLLIGRSGGQLLRDHGQRFVLLAAPTRSGKGVSVVIPVLLDYAHSVVVLDIKGENHARTSGYRRHIGQQVFCFQPFAADGRSHRWNPLQHVSSDPSRCAGDLRGIAQVLYPEGDNSGNQRFFTDQARNAFVALGLCLFERHARDRRLQLPGTQPPTLGQLYRLSIGDGRPMRDWLQLLADDDLLSDTCRTSLRALCSQADDTLSSILGSLQAPLGLWADPQLDAATSGHDIALDQVRRQRMTIYLCITPDRLEQAALLVRLFFSLLVRDNTRTLPEQDPTLRHPCLLLLDEFTSMGRIDILAQSVSYMAGYQLRLLTVIQSMAQLDAVYGTEQARNLATNHATQILFAPREQQDARLYSEMLGNTTQRRQQRSQGRDTSHTEILDSRPLLLPQEVKALGPQRQIVLMEGLADAALLDKICYYRERRFRQRLLPATPIPQLPPMEPT